MYTQCPQCLTYFQITPEHLRIAKGNVRCGQCRHVFNASENLTEEPPMSVHSHKVEYPSSSNSTDLLKDEINDSIRSYKERGLDLSRLSIAEDLFPEKLGESAIDIDEALNEIDSLDLSTDTNSSHSHEHSTSATPGKSTILPPKSKNSMLAHSETLMQHSTPLSKGKFQVFLCHSSGDKETVRKWYLELHKEGFHPWLDVENLLPGQRWEIEIPKAVKESNVVLVCLSKSSITKKGYVQKEIKFALDRAEEMPEGAIYIIPAKLEECNLPERLSHWQCVNLYEENGYQKLLKTLHLELSNSKNE
jgi:predicted Zn finger-like uncharacterized protein